MAHEINRRFFLKSILFSGLAVPWLGSAAWGAEENRMLIVYFSHTGHTAKVAEEIHRLTGAEMIQLLPAVPFPTEHNETVRVAEQQARDNYRPALTNSFPPDLEKHELIFLGFPIWSYTMPMLVYTFLESHKFAGCRIAPFTTHQGSGLADSEKQIARLCPGATVLPGLAVRGAIAANCAPLVKAWLEKLNIQVNQ